MDENFMFFLNKMGRSKVVKIVGVDVKTVVKLFVFSKNTQTKVIFLVGSLGIANLKLLGF